MLVIRTEARQVKQLFSRLILDIIREKNTNLCICLLELASDLFSTESHYPQALARFYCIKVKDYTKAVHWAKKAIQQNPDNSCIMDTLGQVHKKHLQKISLEAGETFKTLLPIAQSAIDAFKAVEKTAENDPENNTKFNYSGLFGFLQVCNIIHPKSVEHSDQEYSKFISGLKGAVETKYDFFQWYLAFSRPRIEKENPCFLHRDVEMCYSLYFKQGKSNKMTLNEKKMKSFGGLLHFLKSDINVLKENQSALKNPQSEHETVLYILANNILSQSGEVCEKAEDLQARLQKLWATEAQDRSPEFYLLILLLFWPDEAQPAITNPPDLEKCLEYMGQSYESKYQKYLRGRYLVPMFFLGKERGLQRLVHTSKLQTDLKCLEEGLEKTEIKCIQRINGKVKDHKVFAVIQPQIRKSWDSMENANKKRK